MKSAKTNGIASKAPSKKPTSPLKLKRSSPIRSKHGVSGGIHLRAKSIEIEDEPELDVTPYIVRKDRLVQELESTLAQMDDQISSSTMLQEQALQAEEERTSLLKEIEGTVTEIQSHVLNAKELEIEKKAIEAECNGLKKQVHDLRDLISSKDTHDNGLNHIDFVDGDMSLQSELDRANLRCRNLEKEVQKLRVANEKLWLQGKSGKNASIDHVQRLKQDNAELEKLLQLAEESEDNIARELATCHQSMSEMTAREGELQRHLAEAEESRGQAERERVQLQHELDRLSHEIGSNTTANKIPEQPIVLPERDNEELLTALRKMEVKCRKLEQDNITKQNRISKLENEANTLKENAAKHANEIQELKANSSDMSQQLRPALEKLNKENAALQDALDNAEKELNALKVCLEEERSSRGANLVGDGTVKLEKESSVKNEKPKKGKLGSLGKKSKKTKQSKEEQDDAVDEGDELEGLRKERNDLRSECLALSETVTKVANEKRDLEIEMKKFEHEKGNMEKEIKELKELSEKLPEIEDQKKELNEAHAKLLEMYSDSCEKVESLGEKKRSANEQLKKMGEEKTALESLCKDFQKSIDSIKCELESVQKDVSVKSNEIKMLRLKHEDEKRRLIGMKDGGDKELTKLRGQLELVSEKLADVRLERSEQPSATVERLIGELDTAKQKCNQLEKGKTGIEKRVDAAEKRVTDLERESAKANDLAMEKSVELSRTKRTLEKKIDKLSKENSQLKRKLGELTPRPSLSPRMSPITIETTQMVESEPVMVSSPRAPPDKGPLSAGPTKPRTSSVPREPISAEGKPPMVPHSALMTKRKSLDDLLFRDRNLPPRDQDSKPPSQLPQSRPHSGSIVKIVAGSIPPRQEGHVMVTREDGYYSLPKPRRKSWGEQKVHAQAGVVYQGHHSEGGARYSTGGESNPAFQVRGYRKPGGKVLQEHYV